MIRHEHIGFNVAEPARVAQWYVAHLGLQIVRTAGAPLFPHFLRSPGGASMVEFYHNATVPVPNYATLDPFALHIAFEVDDMPAEHARLIGAGASTVDEIATNAAGDQLVFLRDPWGLALQLVKRKAPML